MPHEESFWVDHEGWHSLLGKSHCHHGHPESGQMAQLLAHVPRAWRPESWGLYGDTALCLQNVFLFTCVFC